MGTPIKKIMPLLLLCLTISCHVDNGCVQRSKNLNFDPSLLNLYGNCGYGYYREAKSAKGLTESLFETKYEDWINSFTKPAEPCTTYYSQERTLVYNSQLYDFNFSFKVIQEVDDPYLICEIGDPGIFAGRTIKIRNNFITGKTFPITVRKIQSYGDSATAYMSGFNTVDSLVLPKKTYYHVYKVTNELAKSQTSNFSVIDFYLDKTDGLIQFVQKNGDVWTFLN